MQTKLNRRTISMPARYLINAALIALFLFGGSAFVGSEMCIRDRGGPGGR